MECRVIRLVGCIFRFSRFGRPHVCPFFCSVFGSVWQRVVVFYSEKSSMVAFSNFRVLVGHINVRFPAMLQCVAVCCSVWQCVAVCCSVMHCVAV